MSRVESCKVRQQNELEVLKSIFGDELRDLRKNRNKKRWQPLDIVVTLTPQKGMSGPAEVYAQIDLHIICSDKYPDEVPTIQLQNSRGLSHQQIAVLSSELENLAQKSKGEVMIFEFSQHVQKYLHEHNKPGYSSFYEEMVSRNQERIQCEMQEKQMKEDKERQVLQDAIQKRQEALKAEMRNRKDTVRLTTDSDIVFRSIPSSPHERGTSRFRRRCVSTSESSEGSLCEHRGTKLIHFDSNKGERQVHRGKCLGHSTKGSVVYAGVDMTTGELLAITEWTLKCTMANGSCSTQETIDIHHTMKQIASLEQELNHLYKLHHPNLVHYLNMKYLQNNNNVMIYVLQEFVVGTTCSFFLIENIPVDVDMLRHLASGVLEALRYLHENNVVHKDLRDTSVYIDHTGVIRLSDYSLDKRLSDMYHSNSLAKTEHDFPTIQGRSGKKADIYRYGILLLSLLKGSIISGDEIDLTVISQLHLRDFISKCLIDDERTRWSAEQLQQHGFIRIPLERGLSPSIPDYDEKEKNLEPEEPDTDIQLYLPSMGRQSRIQNEFEVLKWLGKGAFGDVLKVRNKLDGGIYAIKRIELNPKKKQLNKNITREVKLLSRMNHENVVRYYNSWIESATLDDSVRHSQFTPITTTSSDRTTTTQDKADIVNQLESDEIEKFAPPLRDVEWNISYESRANVADSDDENSDASTDSDSEEHCAFLLRTLLRIESSDSVEFERDGMSQKSAIISDVSNNDVRDTETSSEDVTVKEIQFLYIQMEFCEKSTLRTAIDNDLYEDEERVWRLFREIVEGLAHIHQQGMIHRDLKPVNIFLDSNDHVKIGDFGLATTNILSTLVQTIDADKESQFEKGGSFDVDELGSLTGQVGTALYVAPELSAKTAKAIYNQKVDIYSLGIIFFEMTYKPLATGMERVKILLNLRSKEIVFPPDITETDMPPQVHIIRWLLNHDPSQRPTAQELLSSAYLPPLKLEETDLPALMRHTLSNSQSKAYKYLVASCFAQDVTPAEDITYDMTARGTPSVLSSKKQFLQESVKQKIVEIFQKHGGIYLATPLLMPKSVQHSNFTESSVKLMTRTGSIVSIPHDLRTPFARYIVWNNISHIRRYAIERVFRDKKARGFHPRELYECAFDIISSVDNNLMIEAELIFIIWEIFNELPQIREHNFTVRLNHTSVLQAVLMYCGVEKDKYQDIYSILQDARDGKLTKFQVQTHLISLCLTDQAMETLFNLLETESSVAKITSVLKTITKRKGDAAGLAKEGLKDIETVTSIVASLGVKWPITVVPLLTYNVQQYSGVIYQITCELKHRRRRGGQDVIAAGGRYDKMLVSFKKVLERTGTASKETKQYGAGISISLDKLVSAVAEACENGENKCGIDVAVCCEGSPESEGRREKDMINILREIWSLGLKATTLDLCTMEEILEYCQENSINHIVLLRNGTLKVQTWERDRFQEKKWNTIQDIVEYLQRQSEITLPILNRSESKMSANDISVAPSNPVNVNINFVLSERDKLSGSGRRSFKNTILAQMSSYLQRISHKVPVEIFAVFLEMSVIRTMISFVEIDEEEQVFQKSIQIVIDKHPRHKKYMKKICEEMRELRNEKSKPVEILYSLIDSKHMTLI